MSCAVEECEKPASTATYCVMHYTRLRRHGSVHAVKLIYGDRLSGFLQKVAKADGCWEWTASRNATTGYGQFNFKDSTGKRAPTTAHRAAWELLVGPIPAGMHVDHICFNRGCVNPDHLRLATPKQNLENHRGNPRPGSASGVRGVVLRDGRWWVSVQHNYERHDGGAFDSLEAAEQAAINLRNKLFTFNDVDRQQIAIIDPSLHRVRTRRANGSTPVCGTTTKYRHGCRCEKCRGAHREYKRQAREKKMHNTEQELRN